MNSFKNHDIYPCRSPFLCPQEIMKQPRYWLANFTRFSQTYLNFCIFQSEIKGFQRTQTYEIICKYKYEQICSGNEQNFSYIGNSLRRCGASLGPPPLSYLEIQWIDAKSEVRSRSRLDISKRNFPRERAANYLEREDIKNILLIWPKF